MDKNRGIWIGVAALILVALLGLRWIVSSSSPDSGLNASSATSTPTEASGDVSAPVGVTKQSSDVLSIARNLSGASHFASLLSSTGVSAEITGKGPYTIFVPTDGAFSLLPASTIGSLSAAQKKRLIEYHIVKGQKIDPKAIRSGSIMALSKDVLNFQIGADMTPRVGNAIIIKAYEGSNGVVYLISGVLIPPKK